LVVPSAVVLVLSATLPPLVLAEVKSLLRLPPSTVLIRRSNDRPNIGLVVREMQSTISTLYDISFLVPPGTSLSNRPKKFMLFMKSKELCERAGMFLRRRVEPVLEDMVVWVHADMSREHNRQALSDLQAGHLFGIVCTDVAGMVGTLLIEVLSFDFQQWHLLGY
jgi:superfamily II DNA/RNA helicase